MSVNCVDACFQNWFSSICVNQELLHQGVAVTCHVPTLVNSPVYQKLQRQLLKAEISAEKKGVGIWKRPSRIKAFWEKISSPISWIKRGLSAFQYVRSLFPRKATNHEEK